jgi:hypothetical protein
VSERRAGGSEGGIWLQAQQLPRNLGACVLRRPSWRLTTLLWPPLAPACRPCCAPQAWRAGAGPAAARQGQGGTVWRLKLP